MSHHPSPRDSLLWAISIITCVLFVFYGRLGGYHPFDPYGTATEAELQDNMRELRFDFDDEVLM